MRGEQYVGVTDHTQAVIPAREMKGQCGCKVSSNKCKTFSLLDRKLIFGSQRWKLIEYSI